MTLAAYLARRMASTQAEEEDRLRKIRKTAADSRATRALSTLGPPLRKTVRKHNT